MNTTQAKQAIARALHEMNTFCNDYSEGDMGAIKHYVRDFHKVICELEGVLTSSAPVAQPDPAPMSPVDCQLVPVEPTQEMIEAGRWCEYSESSCRAAPVDDDTVKDVWVAMLYADRKRRS